jgi:hypothetical protein
MSKEPDYTERRGLDGRIFTKTRPMACPWCGDTFYTFQAEDAPMPPYENPEPHMRGEPGKEQSTGMRHVCDRPKCWDIEQRHQMMRSPVYQKACDAAYNVQVIPEPIKTTKSSRLKRLTA